MNTNTLINIGRTGDTRTREYDLLEDLNHMRAYETFMAVFLKQDNIIEKAYLQVKDKNLSMALHGMLGNVLFMKIDAAFDKRSLPVGEDFLLEGQVNPDQGHAYRSAVRDWDREQQENNPSRTGSTRINTWTFGDSQGLRVPISAHARINYGAGEVDIPRGRFNLSGDPNVSTTDFRFNIGISGFSIPLVWLPIKGGFGSFSRINTVNINPSTGNRNTMGVVEARFLESRQAASMDIDLTPHLEWGQPGNYRDPQQIRNINLIYAMKNQSIVKNALPNDYDTANLAFLCEMPIGTIRKAITKIAKSKPFGNMVVHYDTTANKFVVLVKNGDEEVQTTSISNNIIYTSPDYKGTSSVSYPTWFDFVESTKSNTPSRKGLGNAWLLNTNEMLGVTKDGALVYGLKQQGMTIMTTLTALDGSAPFNAELLSGAASTATKKVTSNGKPSPALSPEELESKAEAQSKLEGEPFYIKWKTVSDTYRTERGEPTVHNVQKVFLDYCLSSHSVTDEDKDEYKRLK